MWPLGWKWKEVGEKERLCLRVSAPFVKGESRVFFFSVETGDWI